MDKMNPIKKKLWLKALRTPPDEGGYIQGQEALYAHVTVDTIYNPETDYWEDVDDADEDRFCCLGVATDLAVQAGICTWEDVVLPYKDGALVDANYNGDFDTYFYSRKDAAEHVKDRGEGKIVLSVTKHEPIYYVYTQTYEDASFPGSQVMDWLGLTPETATELAKMNDEGKDFLVIASWIEENL